MRKLYFLTSQLIFVALQGQSPNSESLLFTNHVYDNRIKSVQLYQESWNLSYPILQLKSDDKMVCQFDLLDDRAESYSYTFIHCDKDWNKSDIFPEDYIDGLTDNPVEDYESSFNTTITYTHYKITFPNDRVRLKLSGNYLLVIYPDDKPEEPSITLRFILTEDAVQIKTDVHRPQLSGDNNAQQQVDFTVSYPDQAFTDPYRNFYAFILQNGRWDNAKTNLKPDFTGVNELKYNSLSDKNVFQGGNEFRYFDIKSLRYQTEFVKEIDFVNSVYNVYLFPSESREFKPYFYWQDFNGKYYIAIQEGKNYNTDADYVKVYFTLKSGQLIAGGDMYVSGALNNWAFDKNNRMTYDAGKGEYQCTMLLKQGWYNYEYAYVKKGSGNGTASLFEGSHYETENDYNILIYYRNFRDRYDRVVGTVTFNTLNRLSN